MADPGPVAQTFFLDDDLKAQFSLDAIVTVVDARHFEQHLRQLKEPAVQVGFADVVILNKTDLVQEADLTRIERAIRAINGTARIHRAQNAHVPVETVLGLGAFDLARALATDANFLEPQYPFEWAGIYELAAGRHILKATGEPHHDHGDHGHDAHDHGHHDHAHADLKLVLMPVAGATRELLDAQVEPAVRVFAEPVQKIESGDHLTPAAQPWALAMQCMGGQWCIDIPTAGSYVLFCEHDPAEFGLQMPQAPAVTRAFASHHHDQAISSIGISDPRPLDARKVNDWLSYLLQNRGEDLLRMKGVLNLRGETRRYVFHAVHMMFDGRPERDWGDAPRNSSVVFIGRNLDRAELEAGFESCIA
jgi:G3E family GTPase